MSLPARQRRVLNHVEDALQASDPQLAAMYGMFARLNAGEAIAAESLGRGRLPLRGPAVCAALLIPVMFAIIAIGALLGGSARGATSCGTPAPASRGGSLISQVPCARPPGTKASETPAAQDAARGRGIRTALVPCRPPLRTC